MRLAPGVLAYNGLAPGRGLAVAVVCIALLVVPLLPCSAANEAQDLLNSAQASYNEGDYEQAKALYQQVIDRFPNLEHSGYALLGLANIHMRNRDDGQTLAMAERVLAEYHSPALLGKAAVCKLSTLANRLQQYQAGIDFAQQWLAENGALMGNHERAAMVIYHSYCYDRLDKPAGALRVYEEGLPLTPDLLTQALYYERLFELQMKNGKKDEALTTARVGYCLCSFDQNSIEAMSNLVKKAFAARGEIFRATQFFAAQEDASKENPLAAIPMPQVTQEQLDQMLAACGQDGRLKAAVYLYAGNFREAMLAAELHMAEAPAKDMLMALGQVARVFKAEDLNLVRGNQFLEYAKAGNGTNPLDAFWQEVGQ